ncbi:MAG: PAS domain S-box protein [Candidatus Thorarchaeota archaeon]
MTVRPLMVLSERHLDVAKRLTKSRVVADAVIVNSFARAKKVYNGQAPDVILSECRIGRTSCLSLARSIQRTQKHPVLVVIAGQSDLDVAAQALQYTTGHIVLDRDDPVHLYRRIEKILSEIDARPHIGTGGMWQQCGSMLDAIKDGVHLVDRNLRIVFVNESLLLWIQLFGIAPDIVGRHIRDAFPFLSESVLSRYQSVFESGTPNSDIDHMVLDGRPVWTEVRRFPVWDGDRVSYVITVLRDITEQKETEQKLAESERVHRTIVRSIGETVLVVDPQNRVTEYHGTEIEHPLLRHAHVLGKSIGEILPQDFTTRFLDRVKQVRATGTAARLDFTLPSDNATEWFSAVITPHESTDDIVVVIRNITDKKAVEELFRSSEAVYHAVFDGTVEGMLICEHTSMKILSANRSICNMFGYAPDEFLQMTLDRLFVNMVAAQVLQQLREASRGQPKRLTTVPCIRRDGTRFVADISCTDVNVGDKTLDVVFVSDVTDRELHQAAIRRSEEWLRSIIQDSPVAIRVFDADGRLVTANHACLDLMGVSSVSDLRPLSIFDDPSVPKDVIEKVNAGERVRSVSTLDFDLVRKLGLYPTYRTDKIYLDVSYSPLVYEDRVQGYIVQANDITLLKRQRDELSEFAHSMAHDIRSSLHTILVASELARQECDSKHIDNVEATARQVIELVSTSVELADAGLVVGTPEKVDLRAIVEEVAARVVPGHIALNIGPMPLIECDRARLVRVVENILRNAVEHGKPTKIDVRFISHADHDEFIILNDGVRIPHAHRGRLFERGYSTKPHGGLGLFIVKKIVEAHGWMISLKDSEETAFSIIMPKRSKVYGRHSEDWSLS